MLVSPSVIIVQSDVMSNQVSFELCGKIVPSNEVVFAGSAEEAMRHVVPDKPQLILSSHSAWINAHRLAIAAKERNNRAIVAAFSSTPIRSSNLAQLDFAILKADLKSYSTACLVINCHLSGGSLDEIRAIANRANAR